MQEQSRKDRQGFLDNIKLIGKKKRDAKRFEIRRIKAFKDVFGIEGNHTGNQKLVLACLMEFSGATSIDHGCDQVRINRITGRKEMLNLILGTARYTNLHELENEALLHMEQMEESQDGYEY